MRRKREQIAAEIAMVPIVSSLVEGKKVIDIVQEMFLDI
jgi:hypothetical protein